MTDSARDSIAPDIEIARRSLLGRIIWFCVHNKLVVFLHPKTTNGVLIELCQDIVKP